LEYLVLVWVIQMLINDEEVEKKTNVQIVFMLLLQIIIIFCSILPFGLQKLVSTFNPAKTVYQFAIEDFVL